jgi:hypothetical protein
VKVVGVVLGVVHDLEHGQVTAHMGLETTCGVLETTVQSIPRPAIGSAWLMELPVCATYKEKWCQSRLNQANRNHDW